MPITFEPWLRLSEWKEPKPVAARFVGIQLAKALDLGLKELTTLSYKNGIELPGDIG